MNNIFNIYKEISQKKFIKVLSIIFIKKLSSEVLRGGLLVKDLLIEDSIVSVIYDTLSTKVLAGWIVFLSDWFLYFVVRIILKVEHYFFFTASSDIH